MNDIGRFLVTSPTQITVGTALFAVTCLDKSVSYAECVVVGEVHDHPDPYMSKFMSKFVAVRTVYGSVYNCSLKDENIPPNSYNNHTWWVQTDESKAWLDSIVSRGVEGHQEYLRVIGENGMGSLEYDSYVDDVRNVHTAKSYDDLEDALGDLRPW